MLDCSWGLGLFFNSVNGEITIYFEREAQGLSQERNIRKGRMEQSCDTGLAGIQEFYPEISCARQQDFFMLLLTLKR